MPDLALLNEVPDGACNVLDRYGGIDAVLIEQVDAVGPEALQRSIGDLPDMLRPAVINLPRIIAIRIEIC
jgi:hypothetical protein